MDDDSDAFSIQSNSSLLTSHVLTSGRTSRRTQKRTSYKLSDVDTDDQDSDASSGFSDVQENDTPQSSVSKSKTRQTKAAQSPSKAAAKRKTSSKSKSQTTAGSGNTRKKATKRTPVTQRNKTGTNVKRQRASTKTSNTTTKKEKTPTGETMTFKSPAEFFAENQNIAGFDNPGKALYTTLRELVENSLDAAEAIDQLPEIEITVEEFSGREFESMHGMSETDIHDKQLYKASALQRMETDDSIASLSETPQNSLNGSSTNQLNNTSIKRRTTSTSEKEPSNDMMYYRVTCRDNGAGMQHDQLPFMLGRVLTGSKYGVRQTRGKFGLGAKMALIWSKKSTGLPIEVKTAHRPKVRHTKASQARHTVATTEASRTNKQSVTAHSNQTNERTNQTSNQNLTNQMSNQTSDISINTIDDTNNKTETNQNSNVSTETNTTKSPSQTSSQFLHGIDAPPTITYCKLDIDIYKNEPRIHIHEHRENPDGFIGTELRVFIGGAWRAYKGRVMQYFQQLAVITPYANLQFHFSSHAHPSRSFSYIWRRRSTQMPPHALQVKYHPSAVNDLLVRQIIDHARAKMKSKNKSDDDVTPNTETECSGPTLLQLLTKEFQCIDTKLARRLIKELGHEFSETKFAATLTNSQIHRLTGLLRAAKFALPDGSCLSPAGEYNLRLGIMKELRPDLLATYASPVAVFEGHPFLVEVGVALGGQAANEGIAVHRFANRIPLLFEAGGDVATRTATHRINWANYKIDHKRDKVGVFVSIVSTKIPFKGTGKEYIGDDIIEIQRTVKHSIQECCKQLRIKLLRRLEAKERQQKQQALAKYIPDVARAVMGVLKELKPEQTQDKSSNYSLNHADESKEHFTGDSTTNMEKTATSTAKLNQKNVLTAANVPACTLQQRQSIHDQVQKGSISEDRLVTCLKDAISKSNHFAMLDHVLSTDTKTDKKRGKYKQETAKLGESARRPAPYFITPRRVTDIETYMQISHPFAALAIPQSFLDPRPN